MEESTAPTATREQMLGGWHSEPADANYCVKQLVKWVSPHHTLKRSIYGQTECGNISLLVHIISLSACRYGRGVFYWEKTFSRLKLLRKKGDDFSLHFFPKTYMQQN